MKIYKIFLFLFFIIILTEGNIKANALNNDYITYEDILFDTEEYNTINNLVIDKLGSPVSNIDILYNMDLEEQYLLIYNNNNYLIYDRNNLTYTEYSKNNISPYYNINDNYIKVYSGPTYYYYSDGDQLFNINNDNVQNSQSTQTYNIITNSRNYNNISKISNAFYFENLYNNIGNNDNGSCTVVALCMLLSYYDTFINDNIIPEQYDKITYESFDDIYADLEDYVESPGIKEEFHQELINYSFANGFGFENSILPINYVEFLNSYYDEFIFSGNYYNSNIDVAIKNCIDNDNPIICTIKSECSTLLDEDHEVVAYAYDDDDIIVHTGWKNNNNLIVNSQFFKECFQINVDAEHVHSDNYWCDCSDEVEVICPCGHKNYIYDSSTDLSCADGSYYKEINLQSNSEIIIELESECNHKYRLDIDGNIPFEIKLTYMDYYDSEILKSENNRILSYIDFIKNNKIYITIKSKDNSSGFISFELISTDDYGAYTVVNDGIVYLQSISHYDHNNYYPLSLNYKVTNAPCFTKFYFSNGNYNYPDDYIKIKDSNNNLLLENEMFQESRYAKWNSESENMLVYFPENGNYTIEFLYNNVFIDNNSIYMQQLFSINDLDVESMIESNTVESLELSSVENIKRFSIETSISLRYKITNETFLSNNINNSYIAIYKRYTNGSYNLILEKYLDFNNQLIDEYLILDKGEYVVVNYSNHDESISINISLDISTRSVISSSMITDPGNGTPVGSQISIYENTLFESQKTYRGNTIIEGFTRLIYFDNAKVPSVSRLDYYWYCFDQYGFNKNNPSECEYALVTNYGTIIAKSINANNAKKVIVVAVYKNDITKIYYKEFQILPQSSSMQFITEQNIVVNAEEFFEIDLGNSVPYNMGSAFTWETSSNIIHLYGNLFDSENTSENIKYGTIIGTYKYNENVKVIINVTINPVSS